MYPNDHRPTSLPQLSLRYSLSKKKKFFFCCDFIIRYIATTIKKKFVSIFARHLLLVGQQSITSLHSKSFFLAVIDWFLSRFNLFYFVWKKIMLHTIQGLSCSFRLIWLNFLSLNLFLVRQSLSRLFVSLNRFSLTLLCCTAIYLSKTSYAEDKNLSFYISIIITSSKYKPILAEPNLFKQD